MYDFEACQSMEEFAVNACDRALVYNRQIMEGHYRRYTSMDLNFPAPKQYPFPDNCKDSQSGIVSFALA